MAMMENEQEKPEPKFILHDVVEITLDSFPVDRTGIMFLFKGIQ